MGLSESRAPEQNPRDHHHILPNKKNGCSIPYQTNPYQISSCFYPIFCMYLYIYMYIIIIYVSYSGGSLLLGQTMYIFFYIYISLYVYIFLHISSYFYIFLYISTNFYIFLHISICFYIYIYIMCVDISHECFAGPFARASLRIAAASPGRWRLGTRASQKMGKIGKSVIK